MNLGTDFSIPHVLEMWDRVSLQIQRDVFHMKPDSHPIAPDTEFVMSLLHSDAGSLSRLLADDCLLIDVPRGEKLQMANCGLSFVRAS